MDTGDSFWASAQEWLRRAGNGILDFAVTFSLGLDEAYLQIERLMSLCSQYGWCLVPDMSLATILWAVDRVNKSSRPHRELYRFLRDHFSADDWLELTRLVDAMTATKPKRRKILYDCIFALRLHGRRVDGRCFNAANLVVPTCVAVVEGILSDFAREIGMRNWNSKQRKGTATSNFGALRTAVLSVCFAYDRPAVDLIFDVLFGTAYAEQEIPSSGLRFNRHKIMHGNWLEYGRIENVVRLYLMARFLDYVVEEHRRRRDEATDAPVTEQSQYSKILSENIVAPMRDMLRERALERGLALPEAVQSRLRQPTM